MSATTPQNKYKNSLCILCYKSATVSSFSESSKFIYILCKHLQIASNLRSKQKFDPELTVMCEDCARFCTSFSQLYIQLEFIQLKLNWKLKKILEMMICAGRVSSRYQSFCKQFDATEGGDEDLNELEKLRDKILGFRKLLIKSCKRKVKNSQPTVKLARFDEAKSSISSSPNSDQIKSEGLSSPPRNLKSSAVTIIMNQKPSISRDYSTQTQSQVQNQNHDGKLVATCHLLTFHALLSLASLKVPSHSYSCDVKANNFSLTEQDISSDMEENGALDDVISHGEMEDEDVAEEPCLTLNEQDQEAQEENFSQHEIQNAKMVDDEISLMEQDQKPIAATTCEAVVTENDNQSPFQKAIKETSTFPKLSPEPEAEPVTQLPSIRSSLRTLLKCKECSKTFTNQYTLSLHQKFHDEMKSTEKIDTAESSSGEESEYEVNDIWSQDSKNSKKLVNNEDEQDPLKLDEVAECSLAKNENRKTDKKPSISQSAEDSSSSSYSSSSDDDEEISTTKKTKTRKRMTDIRIRSTDIPPTTCEQCGDTFECESALEKHRVLVHNLKRYIRCPICSRMYPGFPAYFCHRISKRRKKTICYIKAAIFKPQISLQFPFHKEKSRPYLFCPEEGCYEVFAFKQYLDVHLKTHGNWSCGHCLKDFEKAHDLAWHEITEHKKTQQEEPLHDHNQGFQCTRCDRTFDKRKSAMINHFLHKHLNIPNIQQQEVDKMEENPEDLKGDEDKKQCSVCNMIFNPNCNENSVKRHMKWHNVEGLEPDEISRCKLCNAPFKLPYLLSIHLKTVHLLKKPHECPKCPLKFDCRSKLRLHLKKVHKESGDRAGLFKGKFKCDICGERFGFEGNFKQHLKFHERNKGAKEIPKGSYFQPGNFKCEKCIDGKIFKTKMRLYMHQRNMHKKPKQTWCCDKCGNVFKTKQQLEQHEGYRHTDPQEWKFICTVEGCGSRFFTEQKLVDHLRTHTKECPFICDFCGKKFRYRQYLRAHLVKLHGPSAAATLPGRKYFKPFNQREREKATD